MGNTSSNSSSNGGGGSTSATIGISHSFSSSFKKSNGSLGLSRSELDKRCKPTGLYSDCPWEDKLIRKLVGDGRLAARVRGEDERLQSNAVECPICFLYYNQVNMTDCCSAFCCSECFLQLKPPDGKKNGSDTPSPPSSKKGSSNKTAQAGCDCPFCNAPQVMVKMSSNQANLIKIAEREEEEQRIIESKIRASLEVKNNISKDGISPLVAPEENDDNNADRSFGQSLNLLSSFRGETEQGLLVASVDERKQLEDEMKQQHSHPLVRRIQEEAEEASNARAAAYARSMSDVQSRRTRSGRYGASRSSLFQRSRSERDWSSMFEASYGREDFPSLDDLVVLEAAIMLSMEEEARSRETGGAEADDSNEAEHDRPESSGSSQSFPLLHALISRGGNHQEESDENSSSDNDTSSNGLSSRQRVSRGLSRMSTSSRRRRSRRRNRVLGLGGMTEEEQVAMAITMSLRESSAEATTENENDDDEADSGTVEASVAANATSGNDDALSGEG